MALARGYENGGKLKFILKVVDDEGKPVESATVKVHLQTGLTIQGALFDTASDQKLSTDAEGRAWEHSAMKDLAYFYVFRFYERAKDIIHNTSQSPASAGGN